MRWITFGHEERREQKALAQPAAAKQKQVDPAWSKAVTAAVVLGGLVVSVKSMGTPIKGGIEITRVSY